ncbi:MAG TPA: dihydroorotate dehydrogenase electron transfer subunit [Lachnospiraceae bacterium]|nr:dihydroorotate dehydrogenase electron transfer subunit [Lachnospiraceae bacterium]
MIKENAVVISQEKIASGIYSLVLGVTFAEEAVPGQFVSVYCRDASRLMPRPISLCEIFPDRGAVRLVYRVAGAGTEEFSRLHSGETAEIMGPLGNGFPIEENRDKKVLLIGGGIGIPPLLACAEKLSHPVFAVGYRSETYLLADLKKAGQVHAATEDGSYGICGNVMDVICSVPLEADVIFACGPKPMLKAVKAYAEKNAIECWISMEERMACGIGACLGCVCKTTEINSHSMVRNARVCKDGPVFKAGEVDLS